ncbi:hypothetical protein [Parabacteroides sp. PF5-9]|uniref:hypothetical protein n=1 Tax=Parabacteroides sp. PF5-9 TaxID=1742404 RepID=UPI002475F245|nr:hypothetical protein [Parabacteroides sp. PF5-9]MDH6359025.1 hypothetical protein [Parabacteroides sp. PF5-9]
MILSEISLYGAAGEAVCEQGKDLGFIFITALDSHFVMPIFVGSKNHASGKNQPVFNPFFRPFSTPKKMMLMIGSNYLDVLPKSSAPFF